MPRPLSDIFADVLLAYLEHAFNRLTRIVPQGSRIKSFDTETGYYVVQTPGGGCVTVEDIAFWCYVRPGVTCSYPDRIQAAILRDDAKELYVVTWFYTKQRGGNAPSSLSIGFETPDDRGNERSGANVLRNLVSLEPEILRALEQAVEDRVERQTTEVGPASGKALSDTSKEIYEKLWQKRLQSDPLLPQTIRIPGLQAVEYHTDTGAIDIWRTGSDAPEELAVMVSSLNAIQSEVEQGSQILSDSVRSVRATAIVMYAAVCLKLFQIDSYFGFSMSGDRPEFYIPLEASAAHSLCEYVQGMGRGILTDFREVCAEYLTPEQQREVEWLFTPEERSGDSRSNIARAMKEVSVARKSTAGAA